MDFTVAHMANILKMRKQTQTTTALFLGAKAGGLFRSSQLYSMLRFLGPNDLYSLPLLERYHRCYDILCSFVIQDMDYVLGNKPLLREIRAEVPEICTAELIKQDIFDPILSVSIYREFEEAFQQVGMREMLDFVVAWPKSGAGMPRIQKRDLFTLFKVFGDIAYREYTINDRSRYLQENEALKKVVTDLYNVNLLIVGADQTWDRHIIHALFPHSDRSSVWYVNDEEPARYSILADCLKDCKAELILGADGRYENFFRSLCWHMTGAVPTYQATVVTETMQPVQYHSCFISYSSKDEMLARRLHDDLRMQGVRCWFAPEDIKIGDKFRSRIDEAIDSQDKLLLLLSEHSIASTWVEAEVEAAFEKEEQRQKPDVLFPIRLDERAMQTTQAWAANLRRTRHIGDFTHWTDSQAYQQAFDRLLQDLKA